MSGGRAPAPAWIPPPVKHAIKRGTSALALPTSRLRMLPDYVIIGAQRAGTTSLYFYLGQHPAVAPGVLTKEVHFFDTNFNRGTAWYRTHFPTVLQKRFARIRGGPQLITGEATPYYLFHPLAAGRMAGTLPEAKLIVMLRDPVQRALSHYRHEVTLGFENLTFGEAIEREAQRLEGEVERIRRDPAYQSFSHQHHSYLSRGLYLDQLKVWHSVYPRDQILVVHTEDFFAQPERGFSGVLRFLGLPDWSPPAFKRLNAHPGGQGIDADVRRHLLGYFAEPNQRLYAYLGKDFGWSAPGDAP